MESLRVTDTDGTLEVEDTARPEIGQSDVLIQVVAAGVGRTVYHNIDRIVTDPSNIPRVPGHELVGSVRAVGSCVDHVSPGDLVTTHYYLFCGHCEYCTTGYEPLCTQLRGNVGIDIDGGYAEYVRLPGRNAVRIPDGLDEIAATAIPDAIATPYHIATRRGVIEPGDAVMVLGAGGGVGIHLVQMAIHVGADVTAVDQRPGKLEKCATLGAVHTVNTEHERITRLQGAYDVIVDFTGVPTLVNAATDLLNPHGRVVFLAASDTVLAGLTPRDLVWDELNVIGSRYCSRSEIRRSAELVAAGTIEPIVTDVVALPDVPELLERIAAGDLLGRGATVL